MQYRPRPRPRHGRVAEPLLAVFECGAICKTSEWQHEQEYRLLLWSFGDLKDKPSRKLTYKFADLAGIIFGARTLAEDKLKIIKIIEQKCKAENRTSSSFIKCSIRGTTAASESRR